MKKMKLNLKRPLLLLVAPLALSAASGCMSMQNQQVQDAIQTGTKPYVEAYIEYIGPGSRWMGPATWVLHVNTRELGNPEISVTPEFGDAPAAKLAEAPKEGRAPSPKEEHAAAGHAASPQNSNSNSKVAKATAQAARTIASAANSAGVALREQIVALATSVQSAGETPFAGCLNPIRIRMIREDGALLERQGCRGSTGWSHTVSQSVASFLDAKYGK